MSLRGLVPRAERGGPFRRAWSAMGYHSYRVIGWRTGDLAAHLRVVRDCVRGGGCPSGVKPHAWNMHAHADAIV
jgi:hypothetical protein